MTVSTNNVRGGPHGMHPIGDTWVEKHMNIARQTPGGVGQCRDCHGSNYRGSVLGRSQSNRTITTKFGARYYWRGKQVGCYDCHNGSNSSDPSANTPATVSNATTNTLNSAVVNLTLPVTDPNGNTLTFRVISQPEHGSVGVSNNIATYFPEAGFVGTETFTFAANDTYADSNLGTGTVAVAQGPYSLAISAHVPTNYPAGWPVAFGVFATPVNTTAPISYLWNFGDGTPQNTNQFAPHAFAVPGTYSWKIVAQVGAVSATNTGSITITPRMALAMTPLPGSALKLAWPQATTDVVMEQSDTLGAGAQWTVVTNLPVSAAGNQTLSLPMVSDRKFFRLRQPW
jgi:PKD repeat protein